MDESDYNEHSDYWSKAVQLLNDKLTALSIACSVRYVNKYPAYDQAAGTYKLFTNLSHTQSENITPESSLYDGLVLISSEGIRNESASNTFPRGSLVPEMIGFIANMPDSKYKKLFLTPYPERIRSQIKASYSPLLFDAIVSRWAQALHPLDQSAIESLTIKAQKLEIVSRNHVVAFLQEYGTHKEYLQAAKILCRYKTLCISQGTAQYWGWLSHVQSWTYASIEEIAKENPHIPEYVFSNILSSSVMHVIGDWLFQVSNDWDTNNITEFFTDIPDKSIQ